MSRGQPVTLEQYFAGSDERSLPLFNVVRSAIESVGPVEMRVTKSQVAFRRRLTFAWTWMPGQYVSGNVAPLVLTIDLRRRDESARWKQVVEPRPGLVTHHLEIRSADQIDDEVLGWLREAWEEAV